MNEHTTGSTVRQASVALGLELARSMRESDGLTPMEADGRLNDASRRVVAAMHEQHGQAYLGLINRTPGERLQRLPVWRWDGEEVLNFEAAFVLPAFDVLLCELIDRRERRTTGSVRDDAVLVDGIMKRIQELGGEMLVWS